jgi:hypothetical protein
VEVKLLPNKGAIAKVSTGNAKAGKLAAATNHNCNTKL